MRAAALRTADTVSPVTSSQSFPISMAPFSWAAWRWRSSGQSSSVPREAALDCSKRAVDSEQILYLSIAKRSSRRPHRLTSWICVKETPPLRASVAYPARGGLAQSTTLMFRKEHVLCLLSQHLGGRRPTVARRIMSSPRACPYAAQCVARSSCVLTRRDGVPDLRRGAPP